MYKGDVANLLLSNRLLRITNTYLKRSIFQQLHVLIFYIF